MAINPIYFYMTLYYSKFIHVVKMIQWRADYSFCYIFPVKRLRFRLNCYQALKRDRSKLAQILQWEVNDLPTTGGPAASPDFLVLIAQTILAERPQIVIEFGSGASSIIIARCLEIIGTGSLTSFDHSPAYAEITRRQLARHNLYPTVSVAPLAEPPAGYCGAWYATETFPDRVDVIIIDGPPAALHPETRGGAGSCFSRLRDGGIVFLDDAHREGERKVVAKWRSEYPEIEFIHKDTAKGTVIGRKTACDHDIALMRSKSQRYARNKAIALEGSVLA